MTRPRLPVPIFTVPASASSTSRRWAMPALTKDVDYFGLWLTAKF